MPIYSLTREQKEKLLKEKGTIESEYKELQGKTPTQLWDEDLTALLKKLDELDKERVLIFNILRLGSKADFFSSFLIIWELINRSRKTTKRPS